MTRTAWCYADAEGRAVDRMDYCTDDDALANAPLGCTPVKGELRALLASGALLPPKAPPHSELVAAWTWHAEQLQYVPTPSPAACARDARAERDRRLQACDWTQLPDVPAGTREAWAAYRQALRDVTKQEGFPADIKWPEVPH